MGNSKSLDAYPDIRDILDKALVAVKGVEVEYPANNVAVLFVSRCNTFRGLDRKENTRIYGETDPKAGRSPYDILRISRRENIVRIEKISMDSLNVKEIE